MATWNAARWLGVMALGVAVGGCGQPRESAETATAQKPVAKTSAKPDGEYPAPRFPAYLRTPDTVDELMPTARAFARTKAWRGGLGLGVVNSGETVLIVHGIEAEDIVLEAIGKAAQERGITIVFKKDYEMVGVSKADAETYRSRRQTYTAEDGYMEAANWVEAQFPDAAKAKDWLKGRRPNLYAKLFPENRVLSPEMKAIYEKMRPQGVGPAIQEYLKANPKVKGVFWGKGGGPGLMRALYPYNKKYLGFFTNDNRWEMMSKLSEYPSDLWLLTEEQAMEPLAYVNRLEVSDPEGTNVWADVTEDMAQRWVKGAYQRGHLYLFPNQASGRFGYSVVDYPALQNQWIPREPMTLIQGTIAATNGHTGFYPRMEVEYKDGYIKEIRGGGIYGDTYREFMQYPNINDVTYPFHKHKGYWYFYEIASGTHPKWFRNPQIMEQGALSVERNRSAVVHWGQGLRLWHDPDSPVESPTWKKFTAEYNLPRDHGFHMHSYFVTYKVHLRNTQKWLNILDKGRMTSLDSPEARALASRYGDPSTILAEDWVPEVPGINAPGDYLKDYAPNPYAYAKTVIDKAVAGSYEHFFPVDPRKTRTN